ncbi:glycosyl hydrolase [Paenibacillus oryzisoli]|uniref:glycosyl hydrolase n=1 Tax=Paenibacillus oryzisoli TaxID=1850517 RepID=UPI003D2C9DB5
MERLVRLLASFIVAVMAVSMFYVFTPSRFISDSVVHAEPGLTAVKDDFESSPLQWNFFTGNGGTGIFAQDGTTSQDGSSSGKLSGNLAGSGQYVGAYRSFSDLYDIQELRFWVKVTNSSQRVSVRLKDFTGQWHQQQLILQTTTNWQLIDLTSFGSSNHWGGANDGVWHGYLEAIGFTMDYTVGVSAPAAWFDQIEVLAPYIGYNEHPQRYSDYTDLIDQIIASGTKWIRLSPTWGSIETSKGVYNNALLTKLDDIVNRLTEGGVMIDWILGYTAPWASSMPGDPAASSYKPANWADWEDFVGFIADRYHNQIMTWEVWNEPDHTGFWKSSTTDYKTLLQKAYNKLKVVNPKNKVLMGGLAIISNNGGLGGWFDSLMGLGQVGNYFDVINYHAYGTSAELVDQYNGMIDVINKYASEIGNKPIWITETGYSTLGGSGKEWNKADYADQLYVMNKRWPKIEKMFWYNYRNTASSPVNPTEDNFGLVDNSLIPLKAYSHYQSLGGAESDFRIQNSYPSQAPNALTLYDVPAASGDGSHVVDDGPNKRIPAGTYMYFRINDNWLYNANEGLDPNVYVDVTYLDTSGSWQLQYDSTSIASKNAGTVNMTNSNQWVTKTYSLSDIKFANRQNNSADFRLAAGSSDLVVNKVIVRKESNTGRVLLQTSDKWKLVEHIVDTDPTHEAYNPVALMGGVESRKIEADNKYFYFNVSDGFIRAGDTNVTVGIMFWDSGTDKIKLQYTTAGNAYKAVDIVKTNTNTWRYVQIPISDANFTSSKSYKSDFRIGNGYDGSVEYVSRVDVFK